MMNLSFIFDDYIISAVAQWLTIFCQLLMCVRFCCDFRVFNQVDTVSGCVMAAVVVTYASKAFTLLKLYVLTIIGTKLECHIRVEG